MLRCASFAGPLYLLLVGVTTAGCGDESPETSSPTEPERECVAGEVSVEDGACQRAGLPPDLPCPPGETMLEGTCHRAGMAAVCPSGFEPDGDEGCRPILPEAPCDNGLVAVPGDMRCREIAPCGTAEYGEAPADESTEHVHAAYAGTDSDGSVAKPWRTISEAIDAAAPGAVVAIAAGTYQEDIGLTAKAVRLIGRCPELVEIVGTGNEIAAVRVLDSGASGSEIRSLAITGSAHAMVVSGSDPLTLDRVRIHDSVGRGLDVEDDLGPTSVILTDSLIDSVGEVGIYVSGATVEIARTVIRETRASTGPGGTGIEVQRAGGTPASVTLALSVLERNRNEALFVQGAEATVSDSVLVDTRSIPSDPSSGFGIRAKNDAEQRSSLTVTGSWLARNRGVGIGATASDVVVISSVVRETLPFEATDDFGQGISIQSDEESGQPAHLTLEASAVVHNRASGVVIGGSAAEIRGTLIRGTLPSAEARGNGLVVHDRGRLDGVSALVEGSLIEQNAGSVFVVGGDCTFESTAVRDNADRGFEVVQGPVSGRRPSFALLRSVIERSLEAALLVGGADARVERSEIRDIQPLPEGAFSYGYGIAVQAQAGASSGTAHVFGSLVERATEIGIFVAGGHVDIDASVISSTLPNQLGNFGDGVSVFARADGSSVTASHTHVSDSPRAGISNFGGIVTMGNLVLSCNAFDLEGELFEGQNFEFKGSEENACGCPPTPGECQVLTGGIAPPPALPEPNVPAAP